MGQQPSAHTLLDLAINAGWRRNETKSTRVKATYVDFAATAPLRPQVRATIQAFLAEEWGNASSLHGHGHRARMALEEAREQISRLLGVKVEEIIFTSGATEANNLALLGWMRQQPEGSHLIVSAVEHPSVWEAAEALTYEGYRMDLAPVDRHGRLDLERLSTLIRPETSLLSVMAVNNEVGTIQPIAEVAALPRTFKLHVDAVQSNWVGWPDLEGIDMLSLSAHKLGGPVGSGCLFLRQGLRLQPLLLGGSQEDHRRAGTSNVLSAVALAQAMQVSHQQRAEECQLLIALRQALEEGLRKLEGAHLLAVDGQRSPHVSSWYFDGVTAESLLVLLDLEGISASSGSACSSHSLEPSRVLLAMGLSPQQSRGLIRFSLGFSSTLQDVERILEVMPRLVAQVRRKAIPSVAG